jgi:hypothetical protein
MTPLPTGPNKQPTSAGTTISKNLKFSKKQLVLAFAIAGISDDARAQIVLALRAIAAVSSRVII